MQQRNSGGGSSSRGRVVAVMFIYSFFPRLFFGIIFIYIQFVRSDFFVHCHYELIIIIGRFKCTFLLGQFISISSFYLINSKKP